MLTFPESRIQNPLPPLSKVKRKEEKIRAASLRWELVARKLPAWGISLFREFEQRRLRIGALAFFLGQPCRMSDLHLLNVLRYVSGVYAQPVIHGHDAVFRMVDRVRQTASGKSLIKK